MKKEPLLQLALDPLLGGHVEKINTQLKGEIFDLLPDDDLHVEGPIAVTGEAYVTDEFLILALEAKGIFSVLCGFCNERFTLEVAIQKKSHEVPLEEIPHKLFDLGEFVREELLLEIPHYPLCGKTRCLKRKEIEQFLKKQPSKDEYCPFENL